MPIAFCPIGICYEKAFFISVPSELFGTMGGCISMPKTRFKPKAKYFRKPRKFRRKIASSVSVAPIEHFTGAENGRNPSLPEFVSGNNETHTRTSCRSSKLPNLTIHCSQPQWDHDQVAVNGNYPLL